MPALNTKKRRQALKSVVLSFKFRHFASAEIVPSRVVLPLHGTQESACYVLLLSPEAICNLIDEPPKLPYFVVNSLEIPSSYGLT
jgi:hypothetical protein